MRPSSRVGEVARGWKVSCGGDLGEEGAGDEEEAGLVGWRAWARGMGLKA